MGPGDRTQLESFDAGLWNSIGVRPKVSTYFGLVGIWNIIIWIMDYDDA